MQRQRERRAAHVHFALFEEIPRGFGLSAVSFTFRSKFTPRFLAAFQPDGGPFADKAVLVLGHHADHLPHDPTRARLSVDRLRDRSEFHAAIAQAVERGLTRKEFPPRQSCRVWLYSRWRQLDQYSDAPRRVELPRITIAMRRPVRFCWYRMFLSVDSKRSNPASSAACSNSPLANPSHPLVIASTTVWPRSQRAMLRGVPWSKSMSISGL